MKKHPPGNNQTPGELFLPYPEPLQKVEFVNRFDRFIADVRFPDGSVERSHCVNPGRMEGIVRPGATAWVSPAPVGRKRKLLWTLELMEIDGRVIGANTLIPNRIAEHLVSSRLIPGMKRWTKLEREVRYGENSRIDLMLRGARDHLVEVKHCHLIYPDGTAYFPDSVSVRATKHLRELAEEAHQGRRASVLFILQRTDGKRLRPSRVHDPAFADAAIEAQAAGVRFQAAHVAASPEGFRFEGMIPVLLGDDDLEAVRKHREALNPWSGWKRRGKSG